MKGFSLLFLNIVSVGFIALAAFVIESGREGWGWCVLCAVLCALYPSRVEKCDDDDDDDDDEKKSSL